MLSFPPFRTRLGSERLRTTVAAYILQNTESTNAFRRFLLICTTEKSDFGQRVRVFSRVDAGSRAWGPHRPTPTLCADKLPR